MKKHILLISTFILSFILLAGNVNAEDNIRLSCLYDGNKSGLFSAQGITLITQTESGDVNVYYTKEPFINRNDLYDYPITSPIFFNTKRTEKGHLEKTGENNIGEQLKEKGCPKYLDYNAKNIYYTYDTPKDDSEKRSINGFYSYYPLISEDIPKENTPSKELRCEYPKLAYQKEFIITQSKDGKITTTYDGKEKKVNFSNDESNTGYNVKTGKFDKCPFCVNVHNDYADFYNGESDASCKNSYSGLVDSNNTDWKFTCVYGTAREYTIIKEITLSYNENNFEITFTSPNPNVDPSYIINKFIAAQLWESNSNSCPSHLNLDTEAGGGLSYLYLESDKGIRYTLISHSSSEDPPSPEPEPEPTNCKDLFGEDGEEVIQIINDVMRIIRLAVPILLIVLGITDFFRATFNDSEEGMKKDRDRFIKRIIAAIIVFIVPFFVNLILKIANNVWSDINADTCVTEQK